MAAKVSGFDMTIAMNNENAPAAITVSLVSHGHGSMVAEVLGDLAAIPEVARIVLTLNIPEAMPAVPPSLQQKLMVIENDAPKGFAANHNAAFRACNTSYFCVLNPDVRFTSNPFPELLRALRDTNAGMSAPLVVNSAGGVEDSARHFPTPFTLFRKMLGQAHGVYSIPRGSAWFYPQWVAGMFMLFDSKAFAGLKGFDEGYFLYYEDVDICARLWKRDGGLVMCPAVEIVHNAQRASRRNYRFFCWHLSSMCRYFVKHLGRLPRSGETG